VTAELNIHLENPVSTQTVQCELQKYNIHGRAAIAKLLITKSNAQMRKRCCHDHKTWISDKQTTGNVRVLWSDESSFTLFPTSGRVYVWRTPKEVYNPECLVPTVKHVGGSVMVWAEILWHSIGLITTLHGRITAKGYVGRLGNQVNPMIQTLFPNNDAVSQDDNVQS
jgi:hypothetical protein